jgi:hypothetical protein
MHGFALSRGSRTFACRQFLGVWSTTPRQKNIRMPVTLFAPYSAATSMFGPVNLADGRAAQESRQRHAEAPVL